MCLFHFSFCNCYQNVFARKRGDAVLTEVEVVTLLQNCTTRSTRRNNYKFFKRVEPHILYVLRTTIEAFGLVRTSFHNKC